MIGGMILSTFVATLFVPMMFAMIGERFDEENILRRKIGKRAEKLGRPPLKGKLRCRRETGGIFIEREKKKLQFTSPKTIVC